MSTAQLCLVCNGQGNIKVSQESKQCHGCSGKGWIEVADDWIHRKSETVKHSKYSPFEHG